MKKEKKKRREKYTGKRPYEEGSYCNDASTNQGKARIAGCHQKPGWEAWDRLSLTALRGTNLVDF